MMQVTNFKVFAISDTGLCVQKKFLLKIILFVKAIKQQNVYRLDDLGIKTASQSAKKLEEQPDKRRPVTKIP